MSYAPRLKSKYKEEIVSSLQNKFEYKSPMQVPRLLKICINQGVGSAVSDKKLIDNAVEEMTLITGQRAVAAKSKKDFPAIRQQMEDKGIYFVEQLNDL